jgi:Domain of unknown function (DUF4252)
MIVRAMVTLFLMLALGAPQQVNLDPASARLAEKAASKVEVNLDSSMLQMASAFLSDSDKDQAAAKKIIAGLKGVYVRVFEFDGSGKYSQADLDPIRAQLRGPEWKEIVSATEKDGTTGVWIRQDDSAASGLVVIAAESDEVTVVNLVGTIRPEDLAALSGQLGIPKVKIK